MRIFLRRLGILLATATILEGCRADAQVPGAISGQPEGSSSRQPRLGPAPGSGANVLGGSPGAGEAVLEGNLGSPGPRFVPEPYSQNLPELSTSGSPPSTSGVGDIRSPDRLPVSPLSPFGTLSLPAGAEDEGPPGGLTLDRAIGRLISCNLDLYSKSFEIPQAEADILTASLRANPVLYSDVQLVPYGAFSANRPGGQTQYDLNITLPLDVTKKRQARTLVATRAAKVLQAQFQEAVRQEIDNLYTEFIDVLATRETVREARKSVAELVNPPALPRGVPGQVGRSAEEDQRLEVLREAAEVELAEAEEQLRSDLRSLGTLLRISPADAERLEVRGSLHDKAAPPASGDGLLRLALVARPDLVSYRLGIGRAEADVALALANRYPDLFLVYQPYTFQDNSPMSRKSAHSWGVGMAVPLPLFNRNQGNIRRARLNVSQTQAELAALEDRIVMEVRQAERTYAITRASSERIERSLLPRASQEHDRVYRLYMAGRATELTFLTAERDYDQIVRQYRETLVRHRRSMLKLNTAVGQRILP
jgi:outer membrane protein, heavy metal efflux system